MRGQLGGLRAGPTHDGLQATHFPAPGHGCVRNPGDVLGIMAIKHCLVRSPLAEQIIDFGNVLADNEINESDLRRVSQVRPA